MQRNSNFVNALKYAGFVTSKNKNKSIHIFPYLIEEVMNSGAEIMKKRNLNKYEGYKELKILMRVCYNVYLK